MSIHMGEIIKKLVKSKAVTAQQVANTLNISKSNVYHVYKRETIDLDKLIKCSILLETNLFDYYLSSELRTSIFDREREEYEQEIERLKAELAQKNETIGHLKELTSSQRERITMMEENPRYVTKKDKEQENN